MLFDHLCRDIDPDNSPGMAVVNVEEHGSGTFEYRCLGTSLVFASWFPFAYLEGPGYTLSYNTPSDSHATLLSSTCQLRCCTGVFASSSVSRGRRLIVH